MKEVILELQTATFGHAQTYTTVVIFGGYAALFAVWGLTRDHLSDNVTFWTAALATISILTFVAFEIFRMILTSWDALKVRSLLTKDLPPAQFLAERKRIAAQENLLTQRIMIPIWIVALIITVTTGIGAALILLYSFLCGVAVGLF